MKIKITDVEQRPSYGDIINHILQAKTHVEITQIISDNIEAKIIHDYGCFNDTYVARYRLTFITSHTITIDIPYKYLSSN